MEINMTYLTQLLSDIIIGFVIFDYLHRMYGDIYNRRIIYILAYFGFVAGYFCVNQAGSLIFNTFYGFSMTAITSNFLFKKYPKKIIYDNLFLLYLFLIDTVTIPLFSIVNNMTVIDAMQMPIIMLSTGVTGLFIVFRYL